MLFTHCFSCLSPSLQGYLVPSLTAPLRTRSLTCCLTLEETSLLLHPLTLPTLPTLPILHIFPVSQVIVFFNVAYSYWCRLKPFSNICPLICHHPTALPCICFYLHILFFSCVWLQHIRLIQMPTLPTLMHLETLQFHPIWTHLPPQSPCHQVPSILPLPVFHFTHTVVLFSQICLAV